MQSVGYAALEVIPTFKGIEGKLEAGTSGPLSKAGIVGGGKFGDSAGRSMSSRFVSHAKTAAILAGGVLTGVAAIGIKIGRDAIDEARESQKVGAITARVIKSTGQAANVTAGQVGKLSTAISNRVGIDDEAIQSGANLLLTFKNIQDQAGKGNKVFDQATKVTTDMAVAMAGGNTGGNVDLKSSSILVGKALNDPVKGLTALTRVGVSFTDQQKKNITSLVDQGKTMQAQKIILGELQSEFGGTAAAQATMGDKVTVAWKNIEENIGTGLLPLIDEVEKAFLKKAVPALQDFSNWFQKDGTKKIQAFVHEATPLANSLLPAVGTGFKDVAGFLKDAAGPTKAMIDAFNSLPSWAQKALVIGGAGAVVAKKTGALSLGSKLLTGSGQGGNGLFGLVSKTKPLPVLVVNDLPGGGKGLGLGTAATGAKAAAEAAKAAKAASGEARAVEAAKTAAEAVKAAGGGVASQSSAAARAFKEAMAAHDATVLKEALSFGKGLGAKGLLRGALGAPVISSQEVIKPTPITLNAKDFLAAVREGRIKGAQLTDPEFLKAFNITAAQEKSLLHPTATTTALDGLRANLAQASRSLDLVGHSGSQTFRGLGSDADKFGGKVDSVSTRTDILEGRLRSIPRRIKTELDLDTTTAEERLRNIRAMAGRHISAELSIELAGRGPRQTNLDGVRGH